MPADPPSEVKFEIGHVLFIDIVGYSKLLIDQQSEQVETLRRIVRGTEQFQIGEREGKLLRLPTGDGGALVFRSSPEAAVACAAEIARALRNEPQLRVRMGVHSGPVKEVADLNEQVNIAGAGVNIAQRVMDCGDAGHILLSKRVADDLAPYPKWNRFLHDLGQFEVKHGEKIGLVNFVTEDVGNAETPKKCQAQSVSLAAHQKANRPVVGRAVVVAIGLLIAGIAIGGLVLLRQQPSKSGAKAAASSLPAISKSIAVLPFENLSEEKANAYFADGVQDEILTNLSKIADLKVISRSSVMQYRTGVARNLREIGQQLGVAHLLEGSVQRAGTKVRVNAQLIDARTDAHLWAQTYDRDLADVFAIQSEIAGEIAGQLQAKLAPEEKTRIGAKPTNNSDAYLLYLQANELVHMASSKAEAVNADKIYAQAIALDPQFALARARASMLNSLMYHIGRLPERKGRARALADEALRLAPELGEAHLALGLCFYRIDLDYDAALKEFAIAGAASPNDSEILDSSGFIYRRQGRWRDALAVFERAQNLDPRRAHFGGAPATLRALRQWAPAADAYNHSLQLEPNLMEGWVGLAYVQFAQSGATDVASETLARLPDAQKNKPEAIGAKWAYAMMARDFALAERISPNQPADEFPAFEPNPFFRACVAFARGDPAQAHLLLEGILPLHEIRVRDHPDDPRFIAPLAEVYALLGRKEEAIREARRAVELCPENKDAVSGPEYSATLAFVYAQSGEVDQAIKLLSRLLTTPSADRVTLAHLRLSWEWDPLRQDPRFRKILESPEPKTVYR